MERVHLCEIINCGQPAEAFGLKGTVKTRSCKEHMASLLEKGMQIYDIAGYYFIGSHNDVAEFEERKALVTKGRGNLTVLELVSRSELTEALQAIENVKEKVMRSVEDRFAEVKAVVIGTNGEVENQFEKLRVAFDFYLISKENELSPVAQLTCMDLSAAPRIIKFGIADVSDHISAVLSDSWMVPDADIFSELKSLDESQRKTAIESALIKASESARKGIQEALLYADLLIGEDRSYELEKEKVIMVLLQFERTRIEENLKWLQRSWDLRQRYAFPESPTVRVGQQLANLIFFQYRQYPTAERILRYCYDLVKAQNPESDESMSLCVDMCGLYYASAEFDQLEKVAQWTLQNFAAAGNPAHYYWTVLFYLIDAMKIRGKGLEADAIFDRWRNFRVGNKCGEMLRLFTCAISAFCSGNSADAEKWMLQAWHTGTRHYPVSIVAASICSSMFFVCKETAREQFLLQAQSIYEVTAPNSIYSALNFSRMGQLCSCKQQLSEAEGFFYQAQSIFEVIAPMSIYAANNLSRIGFLFYNKGKQSEAMEYCKKVRTILEIAMPKSVAAGDNLVCMGQMYEAMGRLMEAIDCFHEAGNIFTVNGKEEQKAQMARDTTRCLYKLSSF